MADYVLRGGLRLNRLTPAERKILLTPAERAIFDATQVVASVQKESPDSRLVRAMALLRRANDLVGYFVDEGIIRAAKTG